MAGGADLWATKEAAESVFRRRLEQLDGVAEAAVAGALGVELGGTLRYGERVEHRPLLGRGPRPDGATIAHARSVCDRAQVAVLAAAAVVGWVVGTVTR